MTPIRLIVADLDGTLLNSDHVVTLLTEQAIREVMARGVMFTVATGKTFPSIPEVAELFGIRWPVICGNGTQIFLPDGTVMREDPIPREVAIEATRMAKARGFTPIVSGAMGLIAETHDVNTQELVDHHEPVPEIVRDLEAALRNDYKPYKLVMMNQDLDAVPAFQMELLEAFAGRADVLRSGLLSLVEVVPVGVNKGTALQYILDELGVAAAETMAFGDNCNDVAMIEFAGIGVAMGQSPPDVRARADYVTKTNDEDGVAHAIRKFVLGANDV